MRRRRPHATAGRPDSQRDAVDLDGAAATNRSQQIAAAPRLAVRKVLELCAGVMAGGERGVAGGAGADALSNESAKARLMSHRRKRGRTRRRDKAEAALRVERNRERHARGPHERGRQLCRIALCRLPRSSSEYMPRMGMLS